MVSDWNSDVAFLTKMYLDLSQMTIDRVDAAIKTNIKNLDEARDTKCMTKNGVPSTKYEHASLKVPEDLCKLHDRKSLQFDLRAYFAI